MHINKPMRGIPRKKRKNNLRRPVAGLSRQQAQKSLKQLGMTIDCRLKFLEHARNVVSKKAVC
jgi:hypothetical protein